MADIKLRDRDTLRDAERSTALIALVSDDTNAGVTRKYTLAELQAALNAINPPEFEWERTTIFTGNAEGEEGNSDLTFSNTVYNLDFKTGNTGPRHDFTDGYTHFNMGFVSQGADPNNSDRTWSNTITIPSILLLEATESAPVVIPSPTGTSNSSRGFALAKNSDTSFKVVLTWIATNHVETLTTINFHLTKIEGLKLTIT